MKIEVHHLALAGSVAVSALLGWSTYNAHLALQAKIAAQKQITASAAGFRERITSLREYEAGWDRNFRRIEPGFDLFTIYKTSHLEELAPFSPDVMQIASISNEEVGGTVLPLYRVCMHNDSSTFVVQEPSVAEAMDKLRMLAERPDIRFKKVEVKADAGGLRVALDAACVLLGS